MAFFNGGKIRMEISEEEVLKSWKQFFSKGTNWKDFASGMTYQKYLAISDKVHLKKILQMPVHYLEESGQGFLARKEGAVLALSEKLKAVITNPIFAVHFGDIIHYRTMDYYQRRYYKNNKQE